MYFCSIKLSDRKYFYAVLEGKKLHCHYRLLVLHEYSYHLDIPCLYIFTFLPQSYFQWYDKCYSFTAWKIDPFVPQGFFYTQCLTSTISGSLPSSPLQYQESFGEESLLLPKANLFPYGTKAPSGPTKYHCQDLNVFGCIGFKTIFSLNLDLGISY